MTTGQNLMKTYTEPTEETSNNFLKHTSKNLLQKWLISNFYRQIRYHIADKKFGRVLDVGSGEGFTTRRFKQWIGSKHLVAIDLLNPPLSLGRRLGFLDTCLQADVYRLPFQDHSFDLVLCNEILEHLTDTDKALKEIKRVGRQYWLLSVPNEPWFTIANFLRGKNWRRLGKDQDHCNAWSSRSFLRLIENSGFKIVESSQPFPWTMVLATLDTESEIDKAKYAAK